MKLSLTNYQPTPLQVFLQAKGHKTSYLAEAVGLTPSQFRYLARNPKRIKMPQAQLLANALGISARELLDICYKEVEQ